MSSMSGLPGNRPRRVACAVVGAVFVLVPSLSFPSPANTSVTPCAPVFVPAQGLSCPEPHGLWRVLLADGSSLLTHGPDPVPPRTYGLPEGLFFEFLPGLPPSCISNAETNYHIRVL